MTTCYCKFSIHVAVWLVSLTTKKLLPTALYCNTLKHDIESTNIVSPLTDTSCIVPLIIPTYNYLALL